MGTRGDVRSRILGKAFDLLADHGAAWLTQPRVSKAAGLRQSHLTYYFPTRSDLILALARYSVEILAGPALAQVESGALSPAQLAGILARGLSDRRRIRAVLGLVAAADEDPKVRESLRDFVAMVRERLGRLFAALGLPHDPASIALVHTFIVGAAVLHHARADESSRREAEAAMRFVTAFLPRIAEKKPREPAGRRTTRRART